MVETNGRYGNVGAYTISDSFQIMLKIGLSITIQTYCNKNLTVIQKIVIRQPHKKSIFVILNPKVFDMAIFSTVSHYLVVIALVNMKFGTGMKLDVFYITEAKNFLASLLLPNYDVITCTLADE